jgi:uncharacterized protein YjbI with pentapeptide repeats
VAVLENMCLAHVPAQALPQLVRADRVDGRGARYDAARLDALVSALPLERGQHQAVGDLLFDHAVFEGRLDWSRLDCRGRVSFRGAHFKSEIGLGPDCSFQQVVDFDGARFLADTEFAGCSFVGGASFRDVVFEGTARFSSFFDGLLAEECVFKRYTTLQHLIGQSHITWSTTRFEAPVFIGANVSGRLRFPGSTFVDAVQFSTTKATHVDFVGARFQRGGDLGTLACDGLASFQDATFENPIRLRVRASSLDLRRSLVLRGGEILVEGAFVALAGASFQRPTTLAATRLGAQDRVASENHPAPRLGQLAGADVGELTIDGFDLTACRFAGAHNLDHLRFGDAIDLPQSPQRRVGRRRRTVYDEHQVRVAAAGEKWALAPPPPEPFCLEVQAASSEMPAPPVPVTVAGVYRALRKAREDSKDASGASDFYYGEMEMRRRSEPGLLLRVYWLVSGYGTRASRALVGYLGVVVALGLLMHQFGFEKPQPSLIRAFSFTLTSTVFVGHTPGGGLTPGGDIVQLALRILGPLLIGLALLALRTRVQR